MKGREKAQECARIDVGRQNRVQATYYIREATEAHLEDLELGQPLKGQLAEPPYLAGISGKPSGVAKTGYGGRRGTRVTSTAKRGSDAGGMPEMARDCGRIFG